MGQGQRQGQGPERDSPALTVGSISTLHGSPLEVLVSAHCISASSIRPMKEVPGVTALPDTPAVLAPLQKARPERVNSRPVQPLLQVHPLRQVLPLLARVHALCGIPGLLLETSLSLRLELGQRCRPIERDGQATGGLVLLHQLVHRAHKAANHLRLTSATRIPDRIVHLAVGVDQEVRATRLRLRESLWKGLPQPYQ